MKNTDINNVQFADNEVVALLWGDNLVYRKVPRILAGSFTEAGDYTFKYNNSVNVPIELNDDLTFSQNVKKLTNCRYMFANNSNLKTITAFPTTKEVNNMDQMFSGCSSLQSLDLSGFNTENVSERGMYGLFLRCSSLQSLDLSNFNTENVNCFQAMFSGCSSLQSLDLSNFNTENVTEMNLMFSGCSSLQSLDLSGFNTENVTTFVSMFNGCSSLTHLNVSSFDITNATYLSDMFKGCSSLNSLDIRNFDFTNVQSMNYLFNSCKALTELKLGIFDTSGIKNNDIANIFSYCNNLTDVSAVSMNITNSITLYHCTKLTYESVMLFINGLAEVEETKKITFRTAVYNTLSEEDIAIATSRGWSVVSSK